MPSPKQRPRPSPLFTKKPKNKVAARIDKMVPKGWRPARSLDAPYPVIARLLGEDHERQTARDRSPRSPYDAPRFESRVEQRRLLLISNLFGLLFQMDAQPSIHGDTARETGACVGNQWVHFTIDTTAKLRPRRQPSKTPGRPAEPLAIELKVGRWKHNEADELLFWSDDDEGKLEAKIREIAIAIVLTGERQYRKSHQHSYEWALSSYERALETARKQREDVERRDRERIAQVEADRVSRLFAQVPISLRSDPAEETRSNFAPWRMLRRTAANLRRWCHPTCRTRVATVPHVPQAIGLQYATLKVGESSGRLLRRS
jgi:hypothetical protein